MHPSENNVDYISLKEFVLKGKAFFQYLLKKKNIFLVAGILGAILGLTYAVMKKTIYKAELSFALEDDKSSNGGIGAAMGLANQFGIDLGSGGGGGGAFAGDNIIELMKSRSMIESALLTPIKINGKAQTLAEIYINFNQYRKLWDENSKLKDIHFLNSNRLSFTLQQDSILGGFYRDILKNALTVDKIDKKLSIITVKVNSANELFSKYFAEVLVKTVSDFYIDTKTKKSVQNVAILQKQTDSVRRQLNAALAGVASFADSNPNANPSLQILRVPSQRRQIDVQANQAILTQLVANLEMSKMSLRKETPLIQIIDLPILPLEKDKFGKIKGSIIGAFIAIFLAFIFFTTKMLLQSMLS